MSNITIQDLYDLNETIAAELFDGLTYPWEALPKIGEFIKKLGAVLDPEEYDKVGEDVWIAKSANVFPSAYIHGPAIIGKEAEVRHCAFIRGNAIVGEGAVVALADVDGAVAGRAAAWAVGPAVAVEHQVPHHGAAAPVLHYVEDECLGICIHGVDAHTGP